MKNRSIVVQMIGRTTTTTPTITAYTRQHMHTEDYEDERATEYKAILNEEDTLLHHSSWKRNTPSIDILGSPSIDTQPHQRNWKRASTDIANYSSIDTEDNRVQEGDYSIGSWANDHHHESYAVETSIYEPGADELHEGFTYEELLNIQRRDEADQHQSDTTWGRTRYTHMIDRANCPSIDINPSTSIDINPSTSIDIRSKPKNTVSKKDKFNNVYLTPDEFRIFRDPDSHARELDGRILNVSQKDIADILQTANGAENLFVHQRNIPERQQKDTKEFYDAAGGIDKSFKLRSRNPTRPSIDVDIPTSVDGQSEFCRRAFDSHEYSASIETHTAISIDSGNQKLTDTPHEESIDSRPHDWENDYYNPTIDTYTTQHMHTEEYDEDYEDERATEYKAILDEEDTLLYHYSWKGMHHRST
ncbi:hypothetical protein F2Q70_00012016 [Brassica cretica]|uniref:Uncharacterized protein n=1 Tax=Brassica cretica TaxID=69181 RepID=A0A8S9M1R1_BRACR|nr:hypothetical protein F2Q70_00012016 [Brassica cretica]